MSIVPHLLVFLYIASFCLGIASFCVTLFNRANISRAFGIEPRDLERFLLLLFAFFFTNFILFYSETFLPGSVLIDFFRVAFDCLLVATVYCAIRLNHALIMMHADRLFLIPGGLFIILWGTTYFVGEQMGAVWAITQELVADESGSGMWVMTFSNVKLEAGSKYVVFESAANTDASKAEDVAEHTDLEDKAQTIVVASSVTPTKNATSPKTGEPQRTIPVVVVMLAVVIGAALMIRRQKA